MRLYLDTNILAYMLQHKDDRVDSATTNLIYDYSSQLHTSILCVAELMQLEETRQKKQKKRKKREYGSVIEWLDYNNITIEYITPKHLQVLEKLPVFDKHHDVIDRLMIAQAISDKATLVSSDSEFPKYCEYGLKLHQNKP